MVRLPAEARDFCLLPCVHTDSGAHPDSYLENRPTGGCSLFSDVKQHSYLTTFRHYPSFPPSSFMQSIKNLISLVKLTTLFHLMSGLRMRMMPMRLRDVLRNDFYLPLFLKYSTPLSWKHGVFVGTIWFFVLTRAFRLRRWPVGPSGGGAECLFCEPENLFPITIQMIIVMSAVT